MTKKQTAAVRLTALEAEMSALRGELAEAQKYTVLVKSEWAAYPTARDAMRQYKHFEQVLGQLEKRFNDLNVSQANSQWSHLNERLDEVERDVRNLTSNA